MLSIRPLVVVASALLLGACPSAPPPGELTDDAGRSVVLEAAPARVLPLAPNLTELVAAAAGVERLAAVSQSDTFPPGVAELETFTSFPLDFERIVELAPDLVLASSDVNTVSQADRLAELGFPSFVFTFDEVADVPRALRQLDAILGTREGGRVATDIERRVAFVGQTVAGFVPPRVLLLAGDDALYAFGRDSYASELVRLAGGENLTDGYDGAAAQPGEEDVIRMGPEVIVVLAGDDYNPGDLLEKHPTFFTLPAMQTGRVYGLDPDLVSRPGPRIVEGLERIARLLHPTAFAAGAA